MQLVGGRHLARLRRGDQGLPRARASVATSSPRRSGSSSLITSSSSISGAGRPAAISASRSANSRASRAARCWPCEPKRRSGRSADAQLDLVQLRAVGGVGAAQIARPGARPARRRSPRRHPRAGAGSGSRVRLGARAPRHLARTAHASASTASARASISGSASAASRSSQVARTPAARGRPRTRETSALRCASVRPKRRSQVGRGRATGRRPAGPGGRAGAPAGP